VRRWIWHKIYATGRGAEPCPETPAPFRITLTPTQRAVSRRPHPRPCADLRPFAYGRSARLAPGTCARTAARSRDSRQKSTLRREALA
jgi:hypothetical protein